MIIGNKINVKIIMNIEEIKTKFDLLKKVNNKKFCLVSELAKELKVSKTDLMQFIEDNSVLFNTKNYQKRTRNTIKNLGIGIQNVFLSADENPLTDEWLKKQIKENEKYIYICEFDNYHTIEGYYIDIDGENSELRRNLWRNTEDKINKLIKLGVVEKNTFYLGGYGDCSAIEKEYAITKNGLQILTDNGWTFNKLLPLSY